MLETPNKTGLLRIHAPSAKLLLSSLVLLHQSLRADPRQLESDKIQKQVQVECRTKGPAL